MATSKAKLAALLLDDENGTHASVLPAAPPAPAEAEHLPPIPVTRDQVFWRVDRALRLQDRGLIAVLRPHTHPLDPSEYDIWEVELKNGGQVQQIDLIERAVELGVLDLKVESPMQFWTGTLTP
jgi:hypothetical protein